MLQSGARHRIITEDSVKAFEDFLESEAIPAYRARQVFDWVYKKSEFDINSFRNLPLDFKDLLRQKCLILSGSIINKSVSKRDKTVKFLIKLPDDNLIESALLYSPGGRATACLSTQVGCKISCVFCASGKAGFKRNLTTAEIVSQYLLMKQHALQSGADITNVVFMGIGEPLFNFDNLISAIDLLTSPDAAGLSSRRITVSTAGVAPGIERLAGYKKQIELSVSLHSALDEKRNRLVPLNKKYNIKSVISSVKNFIAITGRMVTFEYALIKGVNDTKEDILALARILKGLNCKINLIPYNPVHGVDFKTPTPAEVKNFTGALIKNHIKAIPRLRKGQDINSGCGQLKTCSSGCGVV